MRRRNDTLPHGAALSAWQGPVSSTEGEDLMRYQGAGGSRLPLIIIVAVVIVIAAVLIYINFLQ